MKLAIVAHPERSAAAAAEEDVRAAAARAGCEITDVEAADVVISIGGDGTLLHAARSTGFATPVVGVDVGHVGYLAEVQPDRAATLVDKLAAGNYTVVERMTVAVALVDGTTTTGLNDVVIEKVMSQHAVRLHCRIDGDPLVTYRSDGLIVATPTGSTAYAFSAGGPVVDPGVEALVVVPVAPHNLFGRALVINPDSELELEVLAGRPVRVNVDGAGAGEVESGNSIRVSRGSRNALLATIDGDGFATRVAANLGVDQ